MHHRPIQGQNRDLGAQLRRWLDVEGLEGPSALKTPSQLRGLSVHGTDGELVLTLEPAEDLRDYHCIGNTDWLGPLLELGDGHDKREL